MRVSELSAFLVRIPLRRAIRHASHERTSTDNVVVRCVLEDGTEGFGEGVPREYVTGETAETGLDLLKRSDLRGQLESCRGFEQAVEGASRVQLIPVPGDDRACQGNAAHCALELALLDAYGRRFDEPVAAVTRLVAKDLYEPRPWVRYSGAIMSASTPAKILLATLSMRLYGFRDVKVKVGIPGQNDHARLTRMRRQLGKRIDIRVDANEAWTPEAAEERIRMMAGFGVSSVEQPVPHAAVRCLAEIRPRAGVPIMLDESLCSRVDAERAAADRTCDLFNLRLSKCGGFIPTLQLARFARENGLGYQLGCQVGETALLSAAGRHFAASVAGLTHVEGSYDRHLVREALGTRDVTFGWGGWARALRGPGLGIEVDRVALERVTLRKETLLG